MGNLCLEPLTPVNTRAFTLLPLPGISLQKAFCQLFANFWNNQIPEPRATRDRYRVWVRFSQTRMGRSLSSNQDVSRVRRRLAGEARPRAVCGTLPLHPAQIIDLCGGPAFFLSFPAPP